jgi:hypothetical protein
MKTGLEKIIVQTTAGLVLGGLMGVVLARTGRSGAGRVSRAWVPAWDWVRRGHERPWTWRDVLRIPAVKVNEKHKQSDCSTRSSYTWLD